MDALSWADLTRPDPRTLAFSSIDQIQEGRAQTPEGALALQQRAIALAELVRDVPDPVRQSFERLRRLHVYGVLCYDLFSVVDDLMWVVLEQALRERFISFYNGKIPFVTKDGSPAGLEFAQFGEIDAATRAGGVIHRNKWSLQLTDGQSLRVPTTLGPLLRWARSERLLDGQRNRVREGQLFEQIRNSFAHGSGFKLTMPGASSSSICELAELINKLWGSSTPGGRNYPAPVDRDIQVVGWAEGTDGQRKTSMGADQLAGFDEAGEWRFIVVRAVPEDNVMDFDARYEQTRYPAELLHSIASRDDTLAWLATVDLEPDKATYQDRLFAVRVDGGRPYLPMRPEVLASLPPERRGGVWHLVRADFPLDAFGHVRHQVDGDPNCRPQNSERAGCAAIDVLPACSWSTLLTELATEAPGLRRDEFSDAHVPLWFSYPDTVGYDD